MRRMRFLAQTKGRRERERERKRKGKEKGKGEMEREIGSIYSCFFVAGLPAAIVGITSAANFNAYKGQY